MLEMLSASEYLVDRVDKLNSKHLVDSIDMLYYRSHFGFILELALLLLTFSPLSPLPSLMACTFAGVHQCKNRRIHILDMFFKAWRPARFDFLVPAQLPEGWRPARCVTLRMMDASMTPVGLLKNVWGASQTVLRNDALCLKIATFFQLAAAGMTFHELKVGSYSGACMRRPGWRWFDPSNFIYAIGWFVFLIQAEHFQIELYASMMAMMRRWPRDWAGKHGIEGLGDFWEWLLSIGYYDSAFECFIHGLSPLFDSILSLECHLERECNMLRLGFDDLRLPRRKPRDAAKIVLLAYSFQKKRIDMKSQEASKYHAYARACNYYYF